MKILFYCPRFEVDTSNHHPSFLNARVKGYLNNGHDVSIITHETNVKDNNTKFKIEKVKKKNTYNFLKTNYHKYDIFIVHFITFRICKFLKNYKIKTIIFFHGTECISSKRYFFDLTSKPYYLLKKIVYNFIHFHYLKQIIKNNYNIRFVPVSKWMKDTLEKDLNLKLYKKNTSIIYNPVSEIFKYKKRKFDQKNLNILIIKNFNSYKYAGDITLNFVKKIIKEEFSQNIFFNIYGTGPIKKSLRDKLKNHKNINVHENYLSPKQIRELFKENDIFFYLTRMDAQSVSISEALSSGLPVVSSNNSAIPEFIKNNENGFLVDNNDYISFRNVIKKIVNDRSILDKIHTNNIKYENIFSIKSITFKELEVLSNKDEVCESCLCDTSIPDLYFHEDGVCNYCKMIIPEIKKRNSKNLDLIEFNKRIDEIRKYGKKRKYDCLIGVSGGVDSSYVVHLAKEKNLNPLLLHYDNGWNSELAISNIKKIASKSNFDLKTYVVNWEEFKDIQKSFLKSGVIDIELVTDHAIFANLVKVARENNIKYILSGNNFNTENGMPHSWIWRKTDFLNIKDIHSKFGELKLKTYPRMNIITWYLIRHLNLRFKIIDLLNLIPYKKKIAIKTLKEKYGWEEYSEKHYESLFTKLYQSYILPKKFNVDKRIIHYSSLIRNNEMTKDEASSLIKDDITTHTSSEDIDYFLKKIDISLEEFNSIMISSPISHFDYKNSEFKFQILKRIYNFFYEKNFNNTPS